MAVHDIDVKHSSACTLDFRDVVTQPGKIRRQDRWHNLNHLRGLLEFYHSGEKGVTRWSEYGKRRWAIVDGPLKDGRSSLVR